MGSSKRIFSKMDLFSGIYKFAPILAGVIGVIYLLLNPTSYLALGLLLLITGIFLVICILGMMPNIFPTMFSQVVEEREIKFKVQYQKYIPDSVAYCLQHPEREAIGRCSICYAPFCADDFIILFKMPLFCRKCAPLYIAEFNLWVSLNAIISIGVLALVGILNEVINLKFFALSIVFIIFFMITIVFVAIMNYTKRIVLSHMKNVAGGFYT